MATKDPTNDVRKLVLNFALVLFLWPGNSIMAFEFRKCPLVAANNNFGEMTYFTVSSLFCWKLFSKGLC